MLPKDAAGAGQVDTPVQQGDRGEEGELGPGQAHSSTRQSPSDLKAGEESGPSGGWLWSCTESWAAAPRPVETPVVATPSETNMQPPTSIWPDRQWGKNKEGRLRDEEGQQAWSAWGSRSRGLSRRRGDRWRGDLSPRVEGRPVCSLEAELGFRRLRGPVGVWTACSGPSRCRACSGDMADGCWAGGAVRGGSGAAVSPQSWTRRGSQSRCDCRVRTHPLSPVHT